MFSSVSLEQRVPQGHPLRAVRELTDMVLRRLDAEFDTLYADSGRPSTALEYILRAQLLQVLYSVRSERLLVEQIDYNLLFRWFVRLKDGCRPPEIFPEARSPLETAVRTAMHTDFQRKEMQIPNRTAAIRRISTSS